MWHACVGMPGSVCVCVPLCCSYVHVRVCVCVTMHLQVCVETCALSVCLCAWAGGRPRCLHTCIAHLSPSQTWPCDSVTPTGMRVDPELDMTTQTGHTNTRGPWSWGMLAKSQAVHVIVPIHTSP